MRDYYVAHNSIQVLRVLFPRLFFVTYFFKIYAKVAGVSKESISQLLPNDPPNPYPTKSSFFVGESLNQSGPGPWCEIFDLTANYNAQLLYETPDPGVLSGTQDYAYASRCISNAGMQGLIFDGMPQETGMDGYKQFMSWVKNQVILGNVVSVGILAKGGTDPLYDHEITVTKVGTNHDPTDNTYYDDDVLYFDDHGGIAIVKDSSEGAFDLSYLDPSIPPGAETGQDSNICTPFIFGYEFGVLAKNRSQANTESAYTFSIVIPGGFVDIEQGANGYSSLASAKRHNNAFSVSGPLPFDGIELFPVQIDIISSSTNGIPNPKDPTAKFNYENPMIGNGTALWLQGYACSNDQPVAMDIDLEVTAWNLTPGKEYFMVEYRFPSVEGVGYAAALNIPPKLVKKCSKNVNCIAFTASDSSFKITYTSRSSMEVLVYRVYLSDNDVNSMTLWTTDPKVTVLCIVTFTAAALILYSLVLETTRKQLIQLPLWASLSGYDVLPSVAACSTQSQDSEQQIDGQQAMLI